MRSNVRDSPATSGLSFEDQDVLAKRIRQSLDRSGYGQLRRVCVTTRPNGRVRLEGSVSSFYLKQVAQTIVLSVPGVTQVRNELQVSARSSVSLS